MTAPTKQAEKAIETTLRAYGPAPWPEIRRNLEAMGSPVEEIAMENLKRAGIIFATGERRGPRGGLVYGIVGLDATAFDATLARSRRSAMILHPDPTLV